MHISGQQELYGKNFSHKFFGGWEIKGLFSGGNILEP
jgi:hypothetical protein